MPLDLEPVEDGNVEIVAHHFESGDPIVQVHAPGQVVMANRRYRSHFSTCPNAGAHRKK